MHHDEYECPKCLGTGLLYARYTCGCTGVEGVDLHVPDEGDGPRRIVDGLVYGASCLNCDVGQVINEGREDLCGYCGCSSIVYGGELTADSPGQRRGW